MNYVVYFAIQFVYFAIQYWPVTLAIIVGVTLLILGVRELGRRRLSAMGFQIASEMDGATCLKANDGSVVFTRSLSSLSQPYININANSRTLERGTQQIPFSRISRIRTTTPTTGLMEGVTRIQIQVTLNDEEVIELGSVSGRLDKVRGRAATITQLVADVIDTAIREPIGKRRWIL